MKARLGSVGSTLTGLLPVLLLSAGTACAASAHGSAQAPDSGSPEARAPAAEGREGGRAAPGAVDLLYVTNEGEASVSVIDMGSHEVVATVDLTERGFTRDARPHHVAVEPDGSHWYVSLIGANTVLKLDRENRIVGRAEFETPGLLALDPDGDLLFVGRSMKAVNPPQRIGRILRSDMSVEEVDVFFPRPHGVEVSPDGEHVWSASLAVNQIATLEAEGGGAPELTSVDGAHHTFVQFARAPDAPRLVATAEMTGKLLVFDLGEDGVPVLSGEVEVGPRPWHPVFSPDGARLYVPIKGADRVAVVDARGWTVTGTIEGRGLAEPHGSALSPDGSVLYVSNNNLNGGYRPEGTSDAARAGRAGEGPGELPGTVVAIDVESGRVLEVIEVGLNPTGVGVAARR